MLGIGLEMKKVFTLGKDFFRLVGKVNNRLSIHGY